MSLSVGLVGYGFSGSVFHRPLIESVSGLVLTAIAEAHPEKIYREGLTISVVPSLDLLLEHEEVNLVIIATPNDTHYDLAKQALSAGKHVVIDKPFVTHSWQADELISLADKQQVMLSIFHNRRWDNDFLTIRHLLATRLLGDVQFCEVHYDRYRPIVKDRWRERAGVGAGILYDLGSHLIDQALFLFGFPQTIWADIQEQRIGAKTDDYFHLVLGYPQRRVILHASSLIREPGPRFQLHGTRGSFIKYGFDSQEAALRAGKRPGNLGWGEDPKECYGELTIDVDDLTIQGKVRTLVGCYEVFYQAIVDAIISGKPAPVSAREARNTIKIIEYALQSYKEQRLIETKYSISPVLSEFDRTPKRE